MKERVKTTLQERILDSVVFSRDIEVGRQDGHQLQIELDLKRQILKESEVKSVNSVSLLISFIWINQKKNNKLQDNGGFTTLTFHLSRVNSPA